MDFLYVTLFPSKNDLDENTKRSIYNSHNTRVRMGKNDYFEGNSLCAWENGIKEWETWTSLKKIIIQRKWLEFTENTPRTMQKDFDDGGIGIIEMLFRCNILALVGGGKNPKYPKTKVMIWDDFQVQCIAELEFKAAVKGVRLRRDRVVVVLENKVFIYNFSDLKLLDQIDTFGNPSGLCAVCPAQDNIVVAILGEKEGQVRIQNYSQNQSQLIEAHNNAISQMTLTIDGTTLATTSVRGTIIRIFDTATGKKLQEFRRGANPAVIHWLAFNKSGTALCLTSDKGTVHIYSCTAAYSNRKSTFSFMSPVLPVLGSSWSSKQFSVNETHSVCAFGEDSNGKGTVIVLGASGHYYKYSFTPESVDCIEEASEVFLHRQ